MAYWSDITQSWHDSEEARAHYESREIQRARHAENANPFDFDLHFPSDGPDNRITPEQIRQLAEAAVRDDESRLNDTVSEREASHFIDRHDDYAATPENGARMMIQLRSQGYGPGQRVPAEALDHAFETLKALGILELREPADGEESQPAITPRGSSASSALRASRTRAVAQPEPEAIDPDTLSDEELMILANRELREQAKRDSER